MDKSTKDCIIGIMLLAAGIASLLTNHAELAGASFGALAGYTIKNGTANKDAVRT